MTTQEAIHQLEEMQHQIVRGSRVFAEIAGVIQRQARVIAQAQFQIGLAIARLDNEIDPERLSGSSPIPAELVKAHELLCLGLDDINLK